TIASDDAQQELYKQAFSSVSSLLLGKLS
ncbi:MAG: hypothetical protein ACJA0Z_003706, partial [Halioglobus sp.]